MEWFHSHFGLADSNLHTFVIVDVDIERPDPSMYSFIHYLVLNVRGDRILTGDEVNQVNKTFKYAVCFVALSRFIR